MVKRKISYCKETHTYSVTLNGLSKKHLLVFKYLLANIAPLGVELHHFHSDGIELPFQRLETFCPLADVGKICFSTQNKVLRDIAQCFTGECDIPERETLHSFFNLEKISKYGK